MPQKIKLKLTISRIGKFRFYLGIAVGILVSILINLWINYFFKNYYNVLLLMKQGHSLDVQYNFSYYNKFFISLLSSSLGFCFVIYMWTGKVIVDRKVNFRFRLSQYNSLYIFGITLFVFLRIVSNCIASYVDGFNFDLKANYGYLPFVIPLYSNFI